MKVTAVVITNKEELNKQLLESLSFSDEILVVVDAPVIPAKAGNHQITPKNKKIKDLFHALRDDFSSQRNYALSKAKGGWIFFVDDDEYVGTELQREILDKVNNPGYSGYYIRRQDVVYHQPLKHGETGKIAILRLARRTAGRFVRPVHEVWKVKGKIGKLQSPLYHIKDHLVSDFIEKMSFYSQIDSLALAKEGKPFSYFRLLLFPIAKFNLNYLFKRGFLDGTAGLFLAYLMAVQSLTVRVAQWENQN
ncbi:MAG: Glycosyl transferase family 2 [Candidatus Collierbacteria bacterium GW2011_GWB1_44_6]|uniref:Glycosyl transferase family 2 n=2 Tax=Candidatus Collieribacteriota TaxID=1752725 RepID=A0A0G1LYC8_9BACT|nr:MAG: Glycosyl transferase family 2 [Candidatus Collierbacteria bacterium GW2011_GWC2_43_12]KKT73842.1 MAG: Glycosyl transferase family 2 [Candidatus Collierbacteria bacterium GW2011_GWB1_44_6]KKT84130.1 MAG: glycosyl transferase family 2 [Microgenomates group bacterium GW2011_GWC1_44_9]